LAKSFAASLAVEPTASTGGSLVRRVDLAGGLTHFVVGEVVVDRWGYGIDGWGGGVICPSADIGGAVVKFREDFSPQSLIIEDKATAV
jgi:hypothetical protein